MTYYGAKELADSFRTVRKNTILVAEDIPDSKYSYRAAPETRSVGELLFHIASSPTMAERVTPWSDCGRMVGRYFSEPDHAFGDRSPHQI